MHFQSSPGWKDFPMCVFNKVPGLVLNLMIKSLNVLKFWDLILEFCDFITLKFHRCLSSTRHLWQLFFSSVANAGLPKNLQSGSCNLCWLTCCGCSGGSSSGGSSSGGSGTACWCYAWTFRFWCVSSLLTTALTTASAGRSAWGRHVSNWKTKTPPIKSQKIL